MVLNKYQNITYSYGNYWSLVTKQILSLGTSSVHAYSHSISPSATEIVASSTNIPWNKVYLIQAYSFLVRLLISSAPLGTCCFLVKRPSDNLDLSGYYELATIRITDIKGLSELINKNTVIWSKPMKCNLLVRYISLFSV